MAMASISTAYCIFPYLCLSPLPVSENVRNRRQFSSAGRLTVFARQSTSSNVSESRSALDFKGGIAIANENLSSYDAACSRREMLGFGGVLAMGLAMVTVAPQANAAEACADLTVSPSGLAYCDSAVGSGIQASKGLLIKAHYTGKLENGQVFDSSYKRAKPLTFRIGVGEVIKGWDQGILGVDGIPPMLAGGKRTLIIPPQLGYGERGTGCRGGLCVIPPNSTLIFDIEFVGKA